jgi:hypothetical protein
MAEYYIGQRFTNDYPEDAAYWCNNNNAYIELVGKESGNDIYEIKGYTPYIPTPIDELTMTAWDFVNVLKTAGLTSDDILDFLNANPDIQLHLTCCQNVYCGVAKSLMPITYKGVTITADMVERAFKAKHGIL